MNSSPPSDLRALRERALARLHAGGATAAGPTPSTQPTPFPADRAVPLTGVQEGLWYLERLHPGTSDAHVSLALRLGGTLDRQRMARAVSRCVAEHPALRSSLIELDGRPHLLARAHAAPLRLLTASPALDTADLLRKRLLEEARRPFSLRDEPLFRATLLPQSDDGHVLLLVAHHLVIDGWSLGVVLADIASAYRDDTTGPRAVPAQAYYRSFGERGPAPSASDLAAWRQMLGGERERLDLPDDRSAEATTSHALVLSATQLARIDAACRGLGLTRFPVLAAAVALVLGRHGAQRDLTLGFPLVRRTGIDAQALVGNCLRTLPLRMDATTDVTFAALASRAQGAFACALSHAEVPLATLAREFDPHRDDKRPPLFDVLVNLVNFPAPHFDVPGLEACPFDEDEPELCGLGAAKLPLALYAEPVSAGGLRLRAVAQGRHFSRARLALLLERLALALDAVAADVHRPLDAIDLRTPACRTSLPSLAEPLPSRQHPSALAAFVDQVARRPDAPALLWQEHVDDYLTLSMAAAALRDQLLHADADDRTPVAVLGERSPGVVAATLAAWAAGAPVLLVDASLPPLRVAMMLAAARARRGIAVGTAGFPAGHGLRVVETSTRLVAGTRPLDAPGAVDDTAYVAFTSGSTGQPKAILGSHNGLGQFLAWQRESFGVGPDDRVAHVTSLSFDVVLRELFLPLSSGACLCIPDSADPGGRAIGEFIARSGVTRLHVVPTLATLWLRAWAAAPAADHALRTVFFAGEPLLDTLVESWRGRFPGCEVVNLYGPTETTLAKCFARVATPARPGVQPIGSAIAGSQALVLEAGDRPLGRGETGEIVIRSPYRSHGYLVDGQLATTFRANVECPDEGCTLYATGDLGRFGLDGTLEILGRRDDQVKIHGVRIELPELRAALQSHPGIDDGYVTTRGERDNKELVAFAVPRERSLQVADIHAHLRARLPAAMVPTQVLLVDELRRLSNGKVDRQHLLALARDARVATVEAGTAQAPENDIERVVHEVWCDVLSRQHIDTRTNFFDAGGHSLLLLEAQHRLERALGRPVSVVSFFAHPSIRALAAHLGATAAGASTPSGPACPAPARAKPGVATGVAARRARLLDARRTSATS